MPRLKEHRPATLLDILSAIDTATTNYEAVVATPDVLGWKLGRAQQDITKAVDLALIGGYARVVRNVTHNGRLEQAVALTDAGRALMAANATEVLRLCADRNPFVDALQRLG